jgi:hypothetical protein
VVLTDNDREIPDWEFEERILEEIKNMGKYRKNSVRDRLGGNGNSHFEVPKYRKFLIISYI